MPSCPYCKTEISSSVYSSTECPSCHKVLHSCICCTFYSPESHYGCRESIDDPVWDKEKANFCDHFRLTDKSLGNKTNEDRAQKSRDALSKLFDF